MRASENGACLVAGAAERLTTPGEYDNNGAGIGARIYSGRTASGPETSGRIPAGEGGMDLEKDNFEDDNELSGLEEEELAGGEVVETEEEELIIGEEEPETVAAPAARPTAPRPKPAAKKPAKKAPKKKAKAKAKAKPKKKAAKKRPAKKKGKKRR
jgi:hypothetical protein